MIYLKGHELFHIWYQKKQIFLIINNVYLEIKKIRKILQEFNYKKDSKFLIRIQ